MGYKMMSEFEQEWQPSERDKRLHDLATRYHTECEAYDRTVCTGPIWDGEIMPNGYRELALVNQNAQIVKRRLRDEGLQHGITVDELHRAISHWRGPPSNAEITARPLLDANRQKLSGGTRRATGGNAGKQRRVSSDMDSRRITPP